ncbi:coth protein-domain-containing protein [Mycotypha africana]|uniref:coth protein-domain-containing protein n=1 Tax=Mycotypha africana TaxID=64632 RepID=UPI0023003C83|nr:coth protein-domain-containing protein [Mycotypha africana]KAI8991448.1 coth protein-domain-containing protein [Mycotypha africana]
MRSRRVVFCLLHLFTAAYLVVADNITYSVITDSAEATNFGIIINNVTYPLTPSNISSILFQGSAPSNAIYTYAKFDKNTNALIQREPFSRPAVSTSTPNEFFNRNWNKKDIKHFELVASIPKNYNRRDDEDLHPEGEIPTIQVVANQSDFDNLHHNVAKDITITADIVYIRKDSVKLFKQAEFEVGGRSSRQLTKISYNIKLNKQAKDDISGFRKLKLRSTVTDPSYMRDYLTSDMLRAANQPATRGSYVRVFLNGRPIGLYTIMEKYDDTWLKNEFNAGNKYKNGIFYEGEGGTGDKRADLSYKGDNATDYAGSAYSIAEKSDSGDDSLNDLIAFIKFINQQLEFQKSANQTSLNATVTDWESHLDVEGFLTCMALDFLQGSWDAYLQNTNNYFLYKSPERNRFIYINWDYDYTMGSGPVSMKKISLGNYNEYGGVKTRPLMVALLNVPYYRALFERRLSDLITNIYNTDKSYPVIDSVVSLIQDDVAWDKTLPHVISGYEFVTPTVNNVLHGDFFKKSNIGTPTSLSILTAVDFIIRLNSDIPFKNAINGNTGHSSLYGVKEWVQVKLDNIKKNSGDTSLLPFLPLKR